jgi:hypothetical protein
VRSRRTRQARGRLAVVAAALLAVQVAKADNPPGGPIIVNPQQTVSPVNLAAPTGDLDFDYLFERDTDRQSGEPATVSTESSYQETIDAQATGNIFNPKFIDFSAGGLFGLEQDMYSGTNGNENGNNVIDGWNVSATALSASSDPFTIFTRRAESYVSPAFSPTLRNTITTSGANLDLQNPIAPTRISISHDDENQTEAGGVTQYELHQDNANWHTDFITLPDQTLTFDYTYQNTDSEGELSPDEKYETNDATLNHTVNFGQNLADSLASSLALTDQTGYLAYQEEHLDENLHCQNSPNLQTHVQYTLDHAYIDDVDQLTNRLDAGFTHRLYESLVTTGDIGGQLFNEQGTDIDDLFGHLGLAYRKDVPAGMLLSNVDLGYQLQNQSEGGSLIPILNQSETFTNNNPVVLSQQNIDPSTIKVISNGIYLQKGLDYAVARLGDLVEIEPLAGGRIPFGGTVLVDYDLLPQPASTISTEDLSAGVRYQIEQGPLRGLTPYVRYSVQDQSIEGEQGGEIPETYNDLTFGSDYRIWKFTFNAERDQHQSSLVPFNADRFSARFDDQTDIDTTVSLSGNYQDTDYYAENDDARDATASASFTRRLNTQASVSAVVTYLNDRDRLFGNTQGLEEDLEFDWQYRKFEFYARGRNAFLNGDTDKGMFQTLEIGIKRSF